MIDLTSLANAAIALLAAIMTAFVVPWIQSHTNLNTQKMLGVLIDHAVQAVEQMSNGEWSGSQKLDAVQKWLEAKGYTISIEEIEAAVLRLHANGYDWENAHREYQTEPLDETAAITPDDPKIPPESETSPDA